MTLQIFNRQTEELFALRTVNPYLSIDDLPHEVPAAVHESLFLFRRPGNRCRFLHC